MSDLIAKIEAELKTINDVQHRTVDYNTSQALARTLTLLLEVAKQVDMLRNV